MIRDRNLKLLFLLIMSMELTYPCFGQLSSFEKNDRVDRLIDRIDILYPSERLYHSSIRYADRANFYRWLTSGDRSWSLRDSLEREQILLDFTEYSYLKLQEPDAQLSGFWSHFYRSRHHLYYTDSEDFNLTIDPIINLTLGRESNLDGPLIQNSRGVRIRGLIDKKVYFHSSILETQQSFPSYITEDIESLKAIPGQGFYKTFQSSIFDSWNGYDFLNAQAYIGFRLTKSIDFQFGHGRNFIGNGQRSLLLSDFGHNYFYTKLTAEVWRLKYQSVFTELAAYSGKVIVGNELVPKKYLAAHYLDLSITDNISIGLFEAVVFGRPDRFELQYLNPVILYRSVEQFLDSPDNALIGLNFKANVGSLLQIYGQTIIDEFKFSQLLGGRGWWANKLGHQLGLKYPSVFGIDNWDLQVEWNSVRPFTYTHRVTDENSGFIPSYSHNSQALAHPLGANFSEWIINNHVQINQKLELNSQFYFWTINESSPFNNGSDILANYQTRTGDFDYYIHNKEAVQRWMLNMTCSFTFLPNYYLDLRLQYRNTLGNLNLPSEDLFIGSLGLRANLWQDPLNY